MRLPGRGENMQAEKKSPTKMKGLIDRKQTRTPWTAAAAATTSGSSAALNGSGRERSLGSLSLRRHHQGRRDLIFSVLFLLLALPLLSYPARVPGQCASDFAFAALSRFIDVYYRRYIIIADTRADSAQLIRHSRRRRGRGD